jgi:hypothetical protein
MRDVSWGDVVLSVVIVSILVGVVGGVSYWILHTYIHQDTLLGVSSIYAVIIAFSAICGLLIVRAYPGPKSDFGPLWAWLLLIVSTPVLGLISILVRTANAESSKYVLSWWALQISVLSFVVVLSVYLNTRDMAITMEAAATKDF